MGMFYRTIRMLEHGIKPVYVFDGKPPQLKSGEVSVDSDFFGAFPGGSSTQFYLVCSLKSSVFY